MAEVRILVVDDEQGICDLLKSELTEQGYQVDAVTDGAQALERLAHETYQLVLSDIKMPVVGGLELLEKIRQQDSDTEVIMMTGFATVEDAVEAMKKGAYDFIQKPFNLDELGQLVEKSLEKSELRRTIMELRETKKRLEETQMQLIQSEKLAGIGQLAAGMAHEINNPLSGVLGFAQLMLEDTSLTTQQRRDLETIESQGRRCRTIIQNLLQFSRRRDFNKESVDLAKLLQVTCDLVRFEFSKADIELVQQIPPALPQIIGEPNQLQQVFLNLLANARQAMEGKKKARLVIEAEQNAQTVLVHFKDNGCGIPPTIQNKIFEPFFTTRPVGTGTGLGLSISYGIMQQHHGRLSVDSREGEGATFTVELPLDAAA